jgi:hypothetical protein
MWKGEVTMEFTFAKQLNYLIHQADGEHVAHCLDMDLVGSGESKEAAIAQLNLAVRGVVFFALATKTLDILSLSGRAPDRYWECFDEAKRVSGSEVRTLDIAPEISPVAVRQCHLTYCLAEAAVA